MHDDLADVFGLEPGFEPFDREAALPEEVEAEGGADGFDPFLFNL